jgi:hypothetical protein
MLLAQFITLGLLTLTTAGGAILGYGARMRQERYGVNRLGAGGNLLGGAEPREVKVIEAQPATLAIEGRHKRQKAGGGSPEAA